MTIALRMAILRVAGFCDLKKDSSHRVATSILKLHTGGAVGWAASISAVNSSIARSNEWR